MDFWKKAAIINTLLAICTVAIIPSLPLPSLALPEKTIPVTVSFCPEKCAEQFYGFFTHDAYCAFFDIDTQMVQTIENKTKKSVIILDKNQAGEINSTSIHRVSSRGLMHNKFCIINSTILSGSANPTHNDLEKNYNNIIIFSNPILAKTYLDEWEHLKNRSKPAPTRTKAGNIHLCFSPQGQCLDLIIENILNAQQSIMIGAFSLTHPRITQALAIAHQKRINITVMVEESQCHQGCIAPQLKQLNITVLYENTPAKIHHKVMIIDGRTVITGSMNPTKNGNNNNDENMVIIDDPTLAQQFMDEFIRISSSLQ